MLRACLAAFIVAFLPGALLYRTPIGARERRAALPADERVFWYVMISLAWSLGAGLMLAALEIYSLNRLLMLNGAIALALLAIGRGRVGFRGTAARPTWAVLLSIGLIALSAWRFFPPSEYVIGGKDPGTYINEGIQISRRGSLVIHDPVVAAVPAGERDLFFPSHRNPHYYGLRFMGFWIQDPATGAVIGQFPQLYPMSIAIGYDLAGLAGARLAVGVWAILGVVAVYFAGARLLGRAAAFAASGLLSLHVIEVWFSRYPNAEVMMQALLFAGLLALARSHRDGDRFFAPIAGALFGLLIFLRAEAVVAVAAVVAALLVVWLIDRKRPDVGFVFPLAVCGVLGWLYLSGPMRSYFFQGIAFLEKLRLGVVAAGMAAGIAALAALVWLRRRAGERVYVAVPAALIGVVLIAAIYALFFRAPGGKLTDYDAYALRTFVDTYLLWPGLVAALIGFVLVARRDFWRDPAFIVVFAVFSFFFFFKIWIVPNHFWMARRFLPVILPGALLFIAAAALGPLGSRRRWWPLRVAGTLFLIGLGGRYFVAAAPVVPHVEYEGMISRLARLAARVSERDLLIVESRNAGADTHVLALPLAYTFGKNVLVLDSPRPDKRQLEAFLEDAARRYQRTFFLGGGGTDLLSRKIVAAPVTDGNIDVPEYEVSPWNRYPLGVRRKDFDYSLYQLTLGGSPAEPGFTLDVGYRDDLNVVRFHAKERSEGRTIRWTGRQSFIAVPGLTGHERELVLVMHDGGRPAPLGPARVDVYFDDHSLGTIEVTPGFVRYRFALPPAAVSRRATLDDPAQIRLNSSVWVPRELLGGPDTRELGVMVDKVEIH